MSTRIEGAGPPVILLTARATLAAGTACLCLTVTQESGDLWRYNLSEPKNARLHEWNGLHRDQQQGRLTD